MQKALLTATVLSHIAQFHKPAIRLLKEHGYEVHVAARDNLAEKNGLTLALADQVFDLPFERTPLALNNLTAYRRLRSIIDEGNYDLIHCNTPVGGIATRLASRHARAAGAKVIYTAHGFHFFTGGPPANWMYYPLERAFARLTDTLITINQEDYARAERFPAGAVSYVPGVGVDLKRFATPALDAVQSIRQQLHLSDQDFVVLSVGELNYNKNHSTVLHAMAQAQIPQMRYLVCGNGPRREYLEELAVTLGINDRVHFLGYRRDIPELMYAADAFCLPSFREGLPMALMEAMAASMPVVCSGIRGNSDLIDAGGGVIVTPSDSVTGYVEALARLEGDPELREAMASRNRKRIADFSVESVRTSMSSIYGLDYSTHAGL